VRRPRARWLAGLVALGAAGCTVVDVVPPFANLDEYKNADQAAHTDTRFIPPTDPRYAENGAPRAGEPTGASIAGDPRSLGPGRSYAPIGGARGGQ